MRRVLAVLAACLSLLPACSDGAREDTGRLTVVAALYPYAWLTEQVGGPDVTVVNLTPPGAEPHDLELSPKQVEEVEGADLVIWTPGLQPAVDDVAPGDGLEVAGGKDEDPHLWLDPVAFADLATTLGDRLAARDGDRAAAYRDRAQRAAAAIRDLDREYRDGLRTCARRDIVVSHEAFGRLTARYGLVQVGIGGLDPEAEPSPQRIGQVVAEVRARKATVVFVEPLLPRAVGETVAREAGVRVEVLDPVEGVSSGSADDYLSVMRRNLGTLRTALGCP